MGSTIQLKPTRPDDSTPATPAWLSLGFRPFFMGGAVLALVWMARWLMAMNGGGSPSGYYGFFGWHAHEMLFGYGVAVIAGFLLTAVRNWTDLPTPTGGLLLALFGLWLAGRVLSVADWLPGMVVAGVDLLFLPALMVALAGPLFRGDRFPNPFVLPLLGLLALANLLVHLELLGITDATLGAGLALAVGTIVLMIAFIAGWAMPMFTGRALGGAEVNASLTRTPGWFSEQRFEQLVMGVMMAWVAAEVIGLPPVWLAPLALVTAGLHAIRLGRWARPGITKVPMLWVLFAGYGWLVAGLALKGVAHLGWVPPTAATHAFTAGAVGVLTCGMMARVSLGHTGRRMMASRAVVTVFLLINLAAMVRVVGALLPPDRWQAAMTMAGSVWMGAFAVFLVVFVPIWLGPERPSD